MIARSHATSQALEALLSGAVRSGSFAAPRRLIFGRYIVTITEPGQPRMPNGIETDVQLRPTGRVAIGGGRLEVGGLELRPGPGWDPIPSAVEVRTLPPGPEPIHNSLAGLGIDGPPGNDLIAGYIAGLTLLHGQRDRARQIAERVAAQADPWSATLLGHAARGEVPEPIHTLLATGDPKPLLRSSGLAGHGWLRGLVSAGLALETWPVTTSSAAPATNRSSHG